MAAPKTENKAIDKQPAPGGEALVHTEVTPTSFEVISHDPDNMGIIRGTMNSDGSWSTVHIDHDGNQTSITHGAQKSASQASHTDVSGGHSVERVAGGSHSQKGNGSNEENAESKTEANDGTVQKASSASSKDMSKGGNGQQHHEGDMTFSVEDGGMHYNVAKDFTVTSTGDLIHFESSGDLSFKTKTNETHKTSGKTTIDTKGTTRIYSVGDINIISQATITLRVGDSYILITPSGITIKAARVDINP
jgi:hypothetical protein